MISSGSTRQAKPRKVENDRVEWNSPPCLQCQISEEWHNVMQFSKTGALK